MEDSSTINATKASVQNVILTGQGMEGRTIRPDGHDQEAELSQIREESPTSRPGAEEQHEDDEEDFSNVAENFSKITEKVRQAIPRRYQQSHVPTIYVVPRDLAEGTNDSYEPEVVCIGLLFDQTERTKKPRRKLEKYKWCCLRKLLVTKGRQAKAADWDPEVHGPRLHACLDTVRGLELQIRDSYGGMIFDGGSDTLALMMLLDGSFLLHRLLKLARLAGDENVEEDNDDDWTQMVGLCGIWGIVARDLLLLKNQIPFIILRGLLRCLRGRACNNNDDDDTLVKGGLRIFESISPGPAAAGSSSTNISISLEPVAAGSSSTNISISPGSAAANSSSTNVSISTGPAAAGSSSTNILLSISPGPATAGSSSTNIPMSSGPAAADSSSPNIPISSETAAADSSSTNIPISLGPAAADSSSTNITCDVKHLLHLFHMSICRNLTRPPTTKSNVPGRTCQVDDASTTLPLWVPCAKELEEAGVTFRAKKRKQHDGSEETFLNVSFRNGVLEIPRLELHDYSEALFRNLIAFEQTYLYTPGHVTIYALFMDCLIKTPEDMRLLQHSGVLVSHMNGERDVATGFFSRVCAQAHISRDQNYLRDVMEDVVKHQSTPWRRWRAALMRNYFSNPWVTTSLVAAFLVLAMTALQTFFAVHGYYKPHASN